MIRSVLTLTLVAIGCVGCGRDATSTHSNPQTRPEIQVTDKMMAALAVADAADGVTDHVVQKCIVCELSMKGTGQLKTSIGGYTVWHCSSACLRSFVQDPAQYLAKISAKPPATGR